MVFLNFWEKLQLYHGVSVCEVSFVDLNFCVDVEALVQKYTAAHHCGNDQDMKHLDYCVKKRVDKATNEINSYVFM